MRYSRLASVEERKNIRSAFFFIILTIAVGLLLFFVGIPLLGRFTAFVSDLGKSDKALTATDKTPPAPPRFDTFPEFTNKKNVTLTGTAEPGVNVKVTFNNQEKESLTDKDGNFSFDFGLNRDSNTFFGFAVDEAGNESQKTKEYGITYDNTKPKLSIEKPADGSQFYGSKQRQISIEGTSEENAQVTINDRIVLVEDDGKFQFSTTLTDGENKFTVKAVDLAENSEELTLTYSFSP